MNVLSNSNHFQCVFLTIQHCSNTEVRINTGEKDKHEVMFGNMFGAEERDVIGIVEAN